MKEREPVVQVRISQEANAKLMVISRTKSLTKYEALSRIVLFYCSNKLDMDSCPSDYKSLGPALSKLTATIFRMLGSIERTEDFIKSLVRNDRIGEKASFVGVPQNLDDSDIVVQPSDDRLPRALGLLNQLLSTATETTDFEGRAAMQIRISQSDFKQFKREYEELCTSRSM